jgi:hypothetical protein
MPFQGSLHQGAGLDRHDLAGAALLRDKILNLKFINLFEMSV